jgi:protein-L-isoaspartate(D-aspartate) O-methyltransferase
MVETGGNGQGSGEAISMAAGSSASQELERRANEGRDIEYEQREWVAQRVAWVVMLLLVVAALLGLLGAPGLLGEARTTASDGSIKLEYDRISRFHAPTRLVIDVSPDFVDNGEIQLWVDAGYAEGLTIESIAPEPESTDLEPGRIVYTFTVSDPDVPLRISLRYVHDSYWRAEAAMGLVNGEPVTFSHIVLP